MGDNMRLRRYKGEVMEGRKRTRTETRDGGETMCVGEGGGRGERSLGIRLKLNVSH